MGKALEFWKWLGEIEIFYESRGKPIPYKNHDKLLSKLSNLKSEWTTKADKNSNCYFEFQDFYEIVENKLDKHMIEDSNNVLTFDMVKGTIHKLLVVKELKLDKNE